ncbi:broad-complex core protein isoforms 1/2/3/4/5-like [Anopheles maculipalpis]|uniref:broad-complex core protein isoforms 1/2/3/4/5-like n=1 Tax=Anopheles maculipalpis TaxID=1496333 RepID=UPI002158EEF1|nr:broad-complex core protein isoforms 1/2/3/4/5-like [Anopheles maculipalpis]
MSSTGLVEKSFVNCDELFYLKWNNFQKNVSTQFEKLREDDDLVDITFACEGRMLTAHKLVLFACSPYFKELLKKNPSPHPVFFMNDVKYEVLKAILQYMYLGEVHITNENLKEFIKTAEGLQIRGLSKETNGDLIIPTHQDVLRRDEKNEQMLDEFCRKRSGIEELQSSTVLNIKRVKTTADGAMTSGGGQDGNVDVEPKVEMVEYLENEAATHQSPTYCSMETYADKNNPRTTMSHLGAINNAGFTQTGTATVSGAGTNQPGGSGGHSHNVHEYKSEDDSSWMEKSLDNISVNSEQSMKYNSGGGSGSGSGGSSGNSDKNKGRSSRNSNRSTDDKANCLTPRCCPVCSRLYSNVSNLRQHMRLIHNPTAVCCPICQKHFNSELYLKRHYSSIHSINPSSTGDGELVDTKPPTSQLQQQQQQQQQPPPQQQAPQPTQQQQAQQQQQQQQQQQPQQQQPPAPTANTWNPYHHHDASQLVNPFIK